MLSGRTTVRTDERSPSVDQASLANLAGGTEQDTSTAVECEVEVGVGEIEKVLKTSLFTAHGDNGPASGRRPTPSTSAPAGSRTGRSAIDS